jgi:hypothetical protein
MSNDKKDPKSPRAKVTLSITTNEDGSLDFTFDYNLGHMSISEIIGAMEMWKIQTTLNK